MSLINCEECNNLISNTAISCPKCGYQIEAKNSGCKFALILIIIVLIILGFIVFGFLDFISDVREGIFPDEN